MTPSVNHEEAIVKAFIPAQRQERFFEITAKPRKRAKLIAELSHFEALNPKFTVNLPGLIWKNCELTCCQKEHRCVIRTLKLKSFAAVLLWWCNANYEVALFHT